MRRRVIGGQIEAGFEGRVPDGSHRKAAGMEKVFRVFVGDRTQASVLAGRVDVSLAFTGVVMVFLPKLIRRGMRADTDEAIDAFGKNVTAKK
jgi:hypothetical protein